jgi:uncharacterized protein
MNEWDQATVALKKKLEAHYQWPAAYPFKFIVKEEQVATVQALFPEDCFSTKLSAQGRYTSMTLEKVMSSSDEVLAVYKKVQGVPGLLAL